MNTKKVPPHNPKPKKIQKMFDHLDFMVLDEFGNTVRPVCTVALNINRKILAVKLGK